VQANEQAMTDLDVLAPPVERTGLSQRMRTMLVSGFLTIALGAAITLVPAPYAIYSPGPVTNVLGLVGSKRLITITGAATYQPKGTLDMTTVQVYGGPGSRVGLLEVLKAWLSRSQAVLPQDQVFPPGQTAAQVDSENAAEMSDSQESATAAGLREAGLTVPETVAIAEVQGSAPAASVLRTGDVITGIDGVPTVDSAALRSTISALQPGKAITVQVRRSGTVLALATTTTSQNGRTILGVGLNPTFRFPVDVKFATRDVGGPSAGMMFALGIVDLLGPGELTGGQQIAGTGTIDSAGNVGPIGGIAQKLVGARSAGAQWFLAPARNCDGVVGNVPDGLRVVRTATLHESRLAVEAIAQGKAASLPTCTR